MGGGGGSGGGGGVCVWCGVVWCGVCGGGGGGGSCVELFVAGNTRHSDTATIKWRHFYGEKQCLMASAKPLYELMMTQALTPTIKWFCNI